MAAKMQPSVFVHVVLHAVAVEAIVAAAAAAVVTVTPASSLKSNANALNPVQIPNVHVQDPGQSLGRDHHPDQSHVHVPSRNLAHAPAVDRFHVQSLDQSQNLDLAQSLAHAVVVVQLLAHPAIKTKLPTIFTKTYVTINLKIN